MMELPANADVEKKDKMSTYVETFLNFFHTTDSITNKKKPDQVRNFVCNGVF